MCEDHKQLNDEMREALEAMVPVAEQVGVTPEELLAGLQALCEILGGGRHGKS